MTGYLQIISLVLSYISLAWTSSKLFYSQRLGIYSEPNLTWQMLLVMLPFNFLMLLGSLTSLILTASYIHNWVLLHISLTITVVNGLLLYWTYFTWTAKNKLSKIFNKMKEYCSRQSHEIFLTSVLASWIAPCTVWANNRIMSTIFWFSLLSLQRL